MTTTSNSTVIDHTTDAAFRTWGSEIGSLLALVGMVQTADTGQINWVTAVRPALNTAAGYEIWRYGDSTLVCKIEYGTGAFSLATPQMWITWGTGSNGSGTITGQTSTRSTWGNGTNPPVSTVTAYTTRMCHLSGSFATGGALAISWKEGAGNSGGTAGGMIQGKTVDGGGNWTSTGFAVMRGLGAGGTGQWSKQCVRTTAGGVSAVQTFNDTINDFVVPGNPLTTTLASTNATQAYQIPVNVPDVLPFEWAALVMTTELPRGTTMLVAMAGSLNRTYISVGNISGQGFGGVGYTFNLYSVAMIYE